MCINVDATIYDRKFPPPSGRCASPLRLAALVRRGGSVLWEATFPDPVQDVEVLEPIARKLHPLGQRLDAQPWLGSRPCTADMLPIVGPAPRHTGLWFCFGHAHHGLTQAASGGRLLAEMISGRDTYADPTPYRVDRF